jgi:LETM1 and EF-hand domain-containing protein 1
LRVARKFQDELTLNNLSRPQLVSLARFMSINHFGTDSFLRSSIENKLKSLAADDRMIVHDGVSSLSISEIVTAFMARGLSLNCV